MYPSDYKLNINIYLFGADFDYIYNNHLIQRTKEAHHYLTI